MGNLNVRDVDVELIREMKANALDAGISLREWIIANLNIAVRLGGKFVKSSESTDLRAEFSSSRLSGVSEHERGSLPVVQQEAAVVFKGVGKLQHDAARISGVDGVQAHNWPIHTGTMPSGSAPVVDAPLHEVLTNKDARLSAVAKYFDEAREMRVIGEDGISRPLPVSPLIHNPEKAAEVFKGVKTLKSEAVRLSKKIPGVKRASEIPPRNPKPAQDAFESPAVDREVIYEQD